MNTITLIPIKDLVESPTNPRRFYDDRALAELAASIKVHGVLEPILVRQVAGDSRYEVVFGSRRLRAAQLAELEALPAMIRDYDDDEVLEVQVIENGQRADVHPIEEGLGYRRMLDRGVWDVESLAGKLGKSPSVIRRRLHLASLTEDSIRECITHSVPIGALEMIAALAPEDQAQAIHWWLEVSSIAELRRRIAHYNRRLADATFPTDDPKLVPEAGACMVCVWNSGMHPTLFDEPNSRVANATCLRPACWQSKINAHLQRVAKENNAVILSADKRSFTDEESGWVIVHGHNPKARKGVVQSYSGPQVVEFVMRDEIPPVKPKADTDAERKQELAARRIEIAFRYRLFSRIIDRLIDENDVAAATLANDDFQRIALARWLTSPNTSCGDSADPKEHRHPGERYGLKCIVPTEQFSVSDPDIPKFMKKTPSVRATAIMLFVAATRTEITVNDYFRGVTPHVLLTAAKLLKIDLAAMRQAVESELAPRPKKKTAKK